jgi:hypothetical protein
MMFPMPPQGDPPGPAFAYVYSGEWVADCPAGCNNVEFLYRQTIMNGPRDVRLSFFQCSNCAYVTDQIVWPRREHDIFSILRKRPIPGTRNWYPKDHPVAVRFHVPHGQTIEDLRAENDDHGVM